MELLKRFALAALVAVVLVVGFAGPAGAVEEASNAVVVGGERVFTIPIGVWNLAVGSVLPIVVGILTRLATKPIVKILLNLLLSALTGLLGTAVVAAGTAVLSTTSIVNAGLTFVVSVAMYAQVWKPLDVTPNLAPNFGL